MINLTIADAVTIGGVECAVSRGGLAGHVVYGPYSIVEPGDWLVAFEVRIADALASKADEVVCVLDVVSNSGNTQLARKELTRADLEAQQYFVLPISVTESSYLEYRVWASGAASLQINKARRIFQAVPADQLAERVREIAFPQMPSNSTFLNENEGYFRGLHAAGAEIEVSSTGEVHVTLDGVTFNANNSDDVNFVGEIFFERAYNITSTTPLYVIDVGLNVGLASLQFATRPFVKKIYAFEPFAETYSRAVTNLKLNPQLAAKIVPANFGLGNGTRSQTILVPESSDSGARTVFSAQNGTPVELKIQDASEAFNRILTEAEAAGARVLAKIDCEGSEYEIFETLEKSGVLGRVWGFVIEWHGGQLNHSYKTLQKPLRDLGYVIIDRSPRVGQSTVQGVFYAFKTN